MSSEEKSGCNLVVVVAIIIFLLVLALVRAPDIFIAPRGDSTHWPTVLILGAFLVGLIYLIITIPPLLVGFIILALLGWSLQLLGVVGFVLALLLIGAVVGILIYLTEGARQA